ncbi:helix-turn-helix transcriptional regulator [Streptomyces alanosinicus]|uniref:LuxR family transcriptional regulator n=1 Tax=Streptomyces alanosinicus TaxID=68171 RepID=A0A918YQE5_9ACTN|nr:hypothetical protein [Streptomyces alanosinicus]GHE12658.1 LuxR family transcriptional regulator [Streptomyces alanosinicus]
MSASRLEHTRGHARPVADAHRTPVGVDRDVLRRHADQLAELAGMLRELDVPDTVVHRGGAEPVAAQIVHRALHHTVLAQVTVSAAAGGDQPALLARLNAELLLREGDVRLLFPSRLLGDEDAMERLRELAGQGAQIRLSPSELPTTAVYDSTVALVPAARSAHVSVVRDSGHAQTLSTLHTAVWNQAADLSAYSSDRLLWAEEGTAARVLLALGRGHTDARAARELGLSVRTYRRHVADLMSRLSASSRFQAGVRAAQAGLIDPP